VSSAVATDVDDPAHEPLPADADHDDSGGEELLLTLPALAGPAPPEAGAGGVVLTRREQKARLRDRNAALARDLARRTGWPHARVNAELNRLAGLRRIQDATVEQLQRRLRQAEAWHARL
jgi:hypothetical protein